MKKLAINEALQNQQLPKKGKVQDISRRKFLGMSLFGGLVLSGLAPKAEAKPNEPASKRIAEFKLTSTLSELRQAGYKRDENTDYTTSYYFEGFNKKVVFTPKIEGPQSSYMKIADGNIISNQNMSEMLQEVLKGLPNGMSNYEVILEHRTDMNSIICYLIPSNPDGTELRINGKPLAFVSVYKLEDGINISDRITAFAAYLFEPKA